MTALPSPPALPTSDPGSPQNAFGGSTGIAAQINAALALCFPTGRVVAPTGGVIAALTSDGDILVNQGASTAVSVTLVAASTATRPVTVKDYTGNASAAYPISIVPNGAEKIDGLSSVSISTAYGSVTLYPLAAGGWYVK